MNRKVLLIDNYDSFTYNLVQYFQELDCEVSVYRNDKITLDEAKKLNPNFLVFSPGPGTVDNPKDVGIGPVLFDYFQEKIPILGVCLGHQMIGKIFGGKIKKVLPVHGKRYPMKILSKKGLFKNFGNKILAMRYHSMVINKKNFPKNLDITAVSDDEENFIMAIENLDKKIFGVQFHPESIGTKTGIKILKNFINI